MSIQAYLFKDKRVDFYFDFIQFPGGEIDAVIDQKSVDDLRFLCDYSCHITCKYHNNNDLIKLFMLTDAIRRVEPSINIHLCMPYFPGARQDRVTGNVALGAKVYADLINQQKYSTVKILDAHSDVVTALVDRAINITPWYLITKAINDFNPTIVVAPDAGAAKKVFTYKIPGQTILVGDKKRDPTTGALSGFGINGSINNNDRVLIVDDICDGGGTFIGLNSKIKEIAPRCDVALYITHGIFSKGIDELLNNFSKIYTTESLNHDEKIKSKITIFSL